MTKKYKLIDLFAGAGGLSEGFMQTGKFEVVLAIERNSDARKTYEKNHRRNGRCTNLVIEDNVCGFDYCRFMCEHGYKSIDLVIGGPPCQGFSNANRQRKHLMNSNNELVKEFIRAVREIEPEVFVMENVKMLQSDKHRFFHALTNAKEVEKFGINMTDVELTIELPDKEDYAIVRFVDAMNPGDDLTHYILEESWMRPFGIVCRQHGSVERLASVINSKRHEMIKAIEAINYWALCKGENEVGRTIEGFCTSVMPIIETDDVEAIEIMAQRLIRIHHFLCKSNEVKKYGLIINRIYDNAGYRTLHARSFSVLEYIRKSLGDLYDMSLDNDAPMNSGVMNALFYGAPQRRERFVMIGARRRGDVKRQVDLPSGFMKSYYTVHDAIADLEELSPSIDYDVNNTTLSIEPTSRLGKYLAENTNNRMRIIKNHIITNSTDLSKKRFSSLSQGQNFHNLDNSMKKNYSVPERTQNSIYLRLDYSSPSNTVTNVRKAMWVHPVKDRAVSVREAARLQTFNDEFEFCGTKDSQYQQVGNAVPPVLARAIAEKVLVLMGDKPDEYIRDILCK